MKDYSITEYEVELALEISDYFKTIKKPVTANMIVRYVNLNYKSTKKFNTRTLRKIVNFYRKQEMLPVITTNEGYYVSYNANDIDRTTARLKSYVKSLLECVNSLENMKRN